MIYQSQNRELEVVKMTRSNAVNDVCICRDVSSPAEDFYTVIAVKDHGTVKQLLSIFEQSEIRMKERIIDTFSWNGQFVLVFPYSQERSLSRFYMGDSYPLARCEEICINFLIACIDCRLPWSVLYLILDQGQVNLSSGNDVYLGYQIDFSDFDPERGEGDCTERAAVLARRMLEPKASEKAVSYILLEKRIANESYQRFTDLYRDIRIAATSEEKRGIIARIKAAYARHKDTLFAILLRLSVVLAIIALAAFITQLLFGDVVWLAFLFNHFKVIGTELLYK